MDLIGWKYTEETRHIVKEIETELESREREILDNGGLMLSPKLEREYVYAMGYMEAVKDILKKIEDIKGE